MAKQSEEKLDYEKLPGVATELKKAQDAKKINTKKETGPELKTLKIREVCVGPIFNSVE